MEPQVNIAQQSENGIPQTEPLLPKQDKSQKSPMGILLVTLITVVVVAIMGFVAFKSTMEQDNTKGDENTTTEKKDDDTEPEPEKKEEFASADKIYEVTNMIRGAQEKGSGFVNASDFEVVESNDSMLVYNYGDFVTKLDKTIVLRPKEEVGDKYKYNSDTNYVYFPSARALMEKALENNGFEISDEIDGTMEKGGKYRYFVDDDGYACEADAYTWTLTCGHKSWISTSRKELLADLMKAFKKEIHPLKVFYIMADEADIKDSPTKPYQLIRARAYDNRNMWYYRKDSESTWVLAMWWDEGGVCNIIDESTNAEKAFDGVNTGCAEEK